MVKTITKKKIKKIEKDKDKEKNRKTKFVQTKLERMFGKILAVI